jgi:hypothetical protein
MLPLATPPNPWFFPSPHFPRKFSMVDDALAQVTAALAALQHAEATVQAICNPGGDQDLGGAAKELICVNYFPVECTGGNNKVFFK